MALFNPASGRQEDEQPAGGSYPDFFANETHNPYGNEFTPPMYTPGGGNDFSQGAATTPTTGSAYPAQGGTTDRSGAVSQLYRTALGREGSTDEIGGWANGGMDLAAIQKAIYGSPEAQAYSKKQTNGATTPTTSGGGDALSRLRAARASGDQAAAQAAFNEYFTSKGAKPEDWSYWGPKLMGADGEYYLTEKLPYAEALGGGKGGKGSGGSGVFDDPATKEWEQALRAIVGKLNQPYDNPDLNPLLDYLRQYATKLQGPAYTPQQMDTLQTQALDPLTSQRDAMRQQIMQRASQRGLDPSSGIVQDEINQLDRSLSQTRSQRQGQFAANAVNLDRQNQQLSGQVLAQIAALQEQNYAGNENRALQALNLLSQIPALADKRLGLALQSMGGQQSNPSSLMQLLSTFQRQGMDQQTQDSNFWAQIGQALMKLFSNG
jgi:hypothetical protein